MSKYDAVRSFLMQQTNEITVRLADLDALVPGGLAASARKDNRWWANDDPSHPHSRAWGDAGFTAHPNLVRGLVTFRPKAGQDVPIGNSYARRSG